LLPRPCSAGEKKRLDTQTLGKEKRKNVWGCMDREIAKMWGVHGRDQSGEKVKLSGTKFIIKTGGGEKTLTTPDEKINDCRPRKKINGQGLRREHEKEARSDGHPQNLHHLGCLEKDHHALFSTAKVPRSQAYIGKFTAKSVLQ